MATWDQAAEATWTAAATELDDDDPATYAKRMQERLVSMLALLSKEKTSLGPLLVGEVKKLGKEGVVARHNVLRIPSVEGAPKDIELPLAIERLRMPAGPDAKLYTLELSSRYPMWRRVLAFAFGAVDVVYSTRHMARISQNSALPRSIIIRRLSLVALILGVVALDVGFSARLHLIELMQRLMGEGPFLLRFWPSLGTSELAQSVDGQLPSLVALGLWLAVYGVIYLGLYAGVRRRSLIFLRKLEAMRMHREEDLQSIEAHHRQALRRWAFEYGETLEQAAEIVAHQARLLVGRSARRLRRRVASAELITLAEQVAARLFTQLPESSEGLRDADNQREHSFKHTIWPREEELEYQADGAQLRAAYQGVRRALHALHDDELDPHQAHETWRFLLTLTEVYPDLLDDSFAARLREAFDESVQRMIGDTADDLAGLQARLDELGRGLQAQLSVASSVVETQVQLAAQAMRSDVAALERDLLEIREGARLEAMAFEI